MKKFINFAGALHIPPQGALYIPRYVLYASRTQGKWLKKPNVVRLPPAG